MARQPNTSARLLPPDEPMRSPKRTALLGEVSHRLEATYGIPALGNYRDPVREIFYILLSAKTTEALYQRADENLWATFRTLADVANASPAEINRCIGGAGLGNKRASHVRQTAERLLSDFGGEASKRLAAMDEQAVFDYLTSLPGLGPKSAFCIMMYSLRMDTFPVDVNVQRVAVRLGVLKRGLKHYQAQRRLPALVPEGNSLALHVGMVVLGRRVCTPRSPHCEQCPLLDLCKFGQRRIERLRKQKAA